MLENDDDQRFLVESCAGCVSARVLLAPEKVKSGTVRRPLSSVALGLVFLSVLTSLVPIVTAYRAYLDS